MDRKYIDFMLNGKNPIFGSGTKWNKINPIINVTKILRNTIHKTRADFGIRKNKNWNHCYDFGIKCNFIWIFIENLFTWSTNCSYV